MPIYKLQIVYFWLFLAGYCLASDHTGPDEPPKSVDDPDHRKGSGLALIPKTVRANRSYKAFQLAQFNSVNAIAFSPDGKLMAVGCGHRRSRMFDGFINLWDMDKKKIIAQIRGQHESIGCLAFSPDGKTLASGGVARDMILWDVATRRLKFKAAVDETHAEGGDTDVRRIRFSSDGSRLAYLDDLRQVRVWELGSGAKERTPYRTPVKADIFDVAFAADNSLRVLARDVRTKRDMGSDTRLWSSATNEPLWSLSQPLIADLDGVFSPDGKKIAILDGVQHSRVPREFNPAFENPIRDAESGGVVARYSTSLPVRTLKFTPDGERMAISSMIYDRAVPEFIRMIDARTGELLGDVDSPISITCMEFSPDGRLLATDENDETVTVRKVAGIIDINP